MQDLSLILITKLYSLIVVSCVFNRTMHKNNTKHSRNKYDFLGSKINEFLFFYSFMKFRINLYIWKSKASLLKSSRIFFDG